jgi:hypothetical protein
LTIACDTVYVFGLPSLKKIALPNTFIKFRTRLSETSVTAERGKSNSHLESAYKKEKEMRGAGSSEPMSRARDRFDYLQ